MAHYVTPAELRVELDLEADDTASLSDAKANRQIRIAEALVERALGPYSRQTSGPQEGRLIAEADVGAWQWEALTDAVKALAARLYRSPELLGPRFQTVSGPDFSYSGPLGPVLGSEVPALLNASGLVVRSARAHR